jgi:MFS superfamily sulfate permease-like transporter
MGMKKYLKLINNPVWDKSTTIRGIQQQKWFIAALGCLPIGLFGGLILDYFFPKNPASVIFMVVFGILSLSFFVRDRRRDHA